MEFTLEKGSDFITLQSLLKAAALCETGGHAKIAITSGRVFVDGIQEFRRGKKIRDGQKVTFEGETVEVKAPAETSAPQ